MQIHLLDGMVVAEFWDCLRLDAGAVQDLRQRFEEHLRKGGRPLLVVDLLGVGYAGSASLGNFVALQRAARSKGGRLVFCNVEPNVFEVFRVSKLDALFTFAKDRDAALVEVERTPAERDTLGTSAPESSTSASAPAPAPERRPSSGGVLRSSRRKNLG